MQKYEALAEAQPSALQSPEYRATLVVQAKPYWVKLGRGQYLGYYKGVRTGSWHARRFMGNGKYLETKLGIANDSEAADAGALSYSDAIGCAAQWFAAFGDQHGRDKRHAQSGQELAAENVVDAPAARLHSSRLNEVHEAWALERPDLSLKDLALFLRIEHAHYLHEQRLIQIARIIGVNIGDMHVLLALRRSGGNYSMRPTDLFRALLVTSGAMTKRIDRLEVVGLVRRLSADDDRRSELVQLTEEGRRKADTAIVVIDKTLRTIVERSKLDQARLQIMDETLKTFIEAMEGFSIPAEGDI